MKTLKDNEIVNLSFPDTEVVEFFLDSDRRLCEVTCSHGYIGKQPDGYFIENTKLVISAFSSVKIQEFKDNTLEEVREFNFQYALKDICEFQLSPSQVILKGFSKIRGYWTEYIFENGKIRVEHT